MYLNIPPIEYEMLFGAAALEALVRGNPARKMRRTTADEGRLESPYAASAMVTTMHRVIGLGFPPFIVPSMMTFQTSFEARVAL